MMQKFPQEQSTVRDGGGARASQKLSYFIYPALNGWTNI